MDEPRLKPHSVTSPWAWLRVLYAVLALTLFAFPGGLVDWLDERNASGWLSAPLATARAIDAASAAVGVKGVGERLRRWFAASIASPDE